MQWIAAVFGDANPWLAAGATLLAGLVRGFAGFGSAMLMAPIFAMLFGSAGMVVTVVAIEIGVGLQLWPEARRLADWRRIVGPMAAAAVIAMPLGLWLLANADKRLIAKVVSGIIVGFVALSFAGWSYRGRRHPAITATVGAISGAMMATTSVGGPPVLMYLLAGQDAPAVHRANLNAYYLVTSFALIALSLMTGVVGLDALLRAVVLFPMMLIGAWTGGRLFRLADPKLYRNAALVLLLAVGVFGLLR